MSQCDLDDPALCIRIAVALRIHERLDLAPGPQGRHAFGRTLRAVREFELAKGLTAKGRISADVLIRLTEAAQSNQSGSKSASAR